MPFNTSKHLESDNQSSVPAPGSGKVRVYSKTDKNLYIKDDTGAETQIGGGGSAAGNAADVERNEKNIMLNALKVAANGELSKSNMIDGFIDAYSDQTGIVAADSSGYYYNSTSDYFSNADSDTKVLLHGDGYAGKQTALSLDGSTGYVGFDDHADWDIGTGPFSWEAWVYWEVVGTVRLTDIDTNEFSVRWWSSRFEIFLNSVQYNFTWTPRPGKWYHILVDRDASNNLSVFVDEHQQTTFK
jgi:hypothetical protein